MMDYILITSAALLLALTFSFQNIYRKSAGSSPKSVIIYNLCLSAVSTVVFVIINGLKIEITPFSLVLAASMATLCLTYTVIGFKILSLGGMTLYTLFLMTGGMVVPYIWGIIFLDEAFSVMRTFGLICIIAAVIISNQRSGKKSFKLIALCITVFFLNGFVSVVSKLHQIETFYSSVSSEGFVILANFSRAVLSLILLVAYKMKKHSSAEYEKKIVLNAKMLIVISFAAISNGLSYLLQLNGASNLPATVLYPFITGGSVVFTAILGYAFFKEKPDKRILISVILCVIGTLFFL